MVLKSANAVGAKPRECSKTIDCLPRVLAENPIRRAAIDAANVERNLQMGALVTRSQERSFDTLLAWIALICFGSTVSPEGKLTQSLKALGQLTMPTGPALLSPTRQTGCLRTRIGMPVKLVCLCWTQLPAISPQLPSMEMSAELSPMEPAQVRDQLIAPVPVPQMDPLKVRYEVAQSTGVVAVFKCLPALRRFQIR